ncbi:MAG: flagellar motor stator protein MotA [Magnetospiraceae bacterium]
MLFLIGFIVVAGSVVGGYLGQGGHLDVLWQPFEWLIIFGAALGAFFIANPRPIIFGVFRNFGKLIKGSRYNKESYIELLTMLFTVFRLAKTKGDLALEAHVENPDESPLFERFPEFQGNHHAVEFTCDYLRLLTVGITNAHEVEAVMEAEIEVHHEEGHNIAGAVSTMGDAMPALGIVAAVLGVIHTMGSITEPPEVLGHLIGGALVGTFSGVLLSYGLVSPIGMFLDRIFAAESQYFVCIKTGIVAHMQGYAPQIAVEMARKNIGSDVRPSFAEVEEAMEEIPRE